VNADDVGEEGGNENHQKRDSHDNSRRLAGGQASRFLEQKSEGPPDGPEHENDITNANQKNIESRKTTRSIYQGDGQGEENPTDDVVADTSSENDKTDNGVQQLQLGENAAKHWESGDSNGNSNEEDKVTKVDSVRDESVIDWHGDCGSKAKGHNESHG